MRNPCPETEILAAYLENNLPLELIEQMEAHLLECRLCRRVISQAIKSESAVPDPIIPRKSLS